MLPMAHLTCVGHTTAELARVLGCSPARGCATCSPCAATRSSGPGTPWVPTDGGIDYASDLVACIRSVGDFCIGVAAFPEGHRDSA